jgi:hypothetical protein
LFFICRVFFIAERRPDQSDIAQVPPSSLNSRSVFPLAWQANRGIRRRGENRLFCPRGNNLTIQMGSLSYNGASVMNYPDHEGLSSYRHIFV